jgi:hypothetical protein
VERSYLRTLLSAFGRPALLSLDLAEVLEDWLEALALRDAP